jgi:glycosyltransferase involved in cell wall biosynthesis
MRPVVSVIIPCYNSSDTIQRAIDSVIRQSFQDIELILVDDASTDSAILTQIIDSYANSRIKYVRHEVNKNGSAARNTGIKMAIGDYIFFLDADDEWETDHVKNSIGILIENPNSIVYSKCRVITTGNEDLVMPLNSIQKNQKVSDYLFCTGGYIATPSISGNSRIFKDNLFDESLIRHQDYELLLRLDHLGFDFVCTNKSDVIVHWEGNDVEKKGGTHIFSFDFAKKHKTYFTSKSYTYFFLKNVIYPLFKKKQRIDGLRIFFKDCYPSRVRIKEWLFFLDYLFFGKLFFVNLYTKLRR